MALKQKKEIAFSMPAASKKLLFLGAERGERVPFSALCQTGMSSLLAYKMWHLGALSFSHSAEGEFCAFLTPAGEAALAASRP